MVRAKLLCVGVGVYSLAEREDSRMIHVAVE